MSKRQEIRERRRREQMRNRIIVILLVVAGALLVAFALILPSINNATIAANATKTAQNATPVPVVTITPKDYSNLMADGVHLGDPNAPVKLDVFADFRCSACLYFSENIEPQILQDYVATDKVYFTFRFYIVIDSNDGTDASYRSANAALCANEQGRFWDYHDTLYANQITEDASLFTDERLIKMAENLNLNMTAFNQCYQAKKYASVIQKDIAQGQSLNITGTPSVVVNGKLVSSFLTTIQAIDDALAGK
jgi:protein-disulfide isomerase